MYHIGETHDKWAELRNIIESKHSGFQFQDDLMEDDWLDEAKVNEDLQRGLIRDHHPNNITPKFLNKMLKRRLAPKRNVALVIVGPPGEGAGLGTPPFG